MPYGLRSGWTSCPPLSGKPFACAIQGMAVEEIARQMGKTVSSAANLIKHGLRGMRKRMNYDSWF